MVTNVLVLTPQLTPRHLTDLSRGVLRFSDFLRCGAVEYVDVNEENNCLVALVRGLSARGDHAAWR